MANEVNLKKGLSTVEKPAMEDGSILIEKDSGRMYLDDDGTRYQLTKKISSGSELPTDGQEGDVFLLDSVSNENDDAYNTIYPIVNEHMNDFDNPHSVTWDQVGAAPGGYGLGISDKNNIPVITDCNSVFANGWYRARNCINCPTSGTGGSPINYGWMLVSSGDFTRQDFFSSTTNPHHLVRYYVDETWGEWEYVNPPMQVGVEYRTTERWNGNPVYTKLIDCGFAANGKHVSVEASLIFRHSGNFNLNHSIPYCLSQKNDVVFWAESYHVGDTLTLYCGQGFVETPYTWYEQIWYI